MKTPRKWQALTTGDIVDVVAPGFGTSMEKVEGAVKYLKSIGLVPRIPADLFGEDPICSNSDEVRARHLTNALQARDSRAIWCIRAGYGALRILPLLDAYKKNPVPKLFVGYSDASTLHFYIQKRWSWTTLHGPLLDRLGEGTLPTADIEELHDAIFGRINKITHNKLAPLNSAALKLKRVTSSVIGGNLTVTASHLGTRWMPKARGHIVFFEDIGERGYRVDRLLKQLEFAKFFVGCRGVVFGEFIEGFEKDGTSKVGPAIARFAAETKIPVFAGVNAGHGQNQRLVPLGSKAILTGGEDATLNIEVGFV